MSKVTKLIDFYYKFFLIIKFVINMDYNTSNYLVNTYISYFKFNETGRDNKYVYYEKNVFKK